MLRFHLPLIEPDGRISRIRLSDKDYKSWFHAFAHGRLRVCTESSDQPQFVIEVGVGIACYSMTRPFVLLAQPPTEPVLHVSVYVTIGWA